MKQVDNVENFQKYLQSSRMNSTLGPRINRGFCLQLEKQTFSNLRLYVCQQQEIKRQDWLLWSDRSLWSLLGSHQSQPTKISVSPRRWPHKSRVRGVMWGESWKLGVERSTGWAGGAGPVQTGVLVSRHSPSYYQHHSQCVLSLHYGLSCLTSYQLHSQSSINRETADIWLYNPSKMR